MDTASTYVLELTRNLHEFQKAGYMCDTVIIVDDGQVRAHSAVLAAASPMFKGALKVNASPMEHTVIMPGMQLSVARIILQYMYTGNFQVEGWCVDYEHVNRLQQAVQEFGINVQLVTEYDNSENECAKTTDADHANVESKANDTAVSAKRSSHEVGVTANNSLTSDGLDSVNEAGGCRQSNRRRQISQKVDLDELNTHTSLRSLYGARTDSDRRCPKGPCPCGTNDEDTEAGMDSEDRQSDLPESHAHPKGPCVCEVCGKVLPDWQRLEQHMNTHPGEEPLRCNVCGRDFALLLHLKRHMKVHIDDRPFICNHCGASFAEKGFLDMHMKAHQPESEKEAGKVAAAQAKQETFHCRKCNETFPSKWKLQRHNTEKHRSRPPLKTPRNLRCTCPICGKSLSYRLSVHMRQHTGERPYQCNTCGKMFYQRSSLRSHLSMHTGVKTHTCAECGKSFRLNSLLNQHMRKHNGDLRHECPLCGKRFWVPTLLRDHLLLHTGERPYQCATCGRKFRLRKELGKHERQHFGEVATRCEVCGLETTSLKRHMLVHTGEKPFRCEQCGKTFRRKEHLRVHSLRVHNIELFPRREKVQAISLDSSLLNMQNEGAETISVDDGGLALVIGDSVVV